MKRSAPLQRRTPLRARPRAFQPRERAEVALTPATRRGSYAGTLGQAVEKEAPVRSETYRRLVADGPCCECGRFGCQAAHPNAGKGMGIKADDRLCFPLCPDCHRAFDQGALYPKAQRRVVEADHGRRTRAAIRAAGLWPQTLPEWKETDE